MSNQSFDAIDVEQKLINQLCADIALLLTDEEVGGDDLSTVASNNRSCNVGITPEIIGSSRKDTGDRISEQLRRYIDVDTSVGGVSTRPVSNSNVGDTIARYSNLGLLTYFQVVGFEMYFLNVWLMGIDERGVVVLYAEVFVVKRSRNAKMFDSQLLMKNLRPVKCWRGIIEVCELRCLGYIVECHNYLWKSAFRQVVGFNM